MKEIGCEINETVLHTLCCKWIDKRIMLLPYRWYMNNKCWIVYYQGQFV